MRSSIYGIYAAAALVAGTCTAQAADLIIDAPAAAPGIVAVAGNWDGAYFGVFGGYGWGDLSYVSPDFSDGANDYDDEADGLFAGIQAGYNWQHDQLVFGLQADFAYLAGEGGEGDKITWLGTVTGRAGVAFDNVLVYGEAGLAYGLGEYAMEWLPDYTESSDWHVGWVVGAGVEVAVTDGINLFAEYNYVDLGSSNHFANWGPVLGQGVDISYTAHVVKAGLNFQF